LACGKKQKEEVPPWVEEQSGKIEGRRETLAYLKKKARRIHPRLRGRCSSCRCKRENPGRLATSREKKKLARPPAKQKARAGLEEKSVKDSAGRPGTFT